MTDKDTALIEEMMHRYKQEVRTAPTKHVSDKEIVARAKMIIEEVIEFCDAAGLVTNLPAKGEIEVGRDPFKDVDLVEVTDALVDTVVVTKGGYHVFGVDGDAVMQNQVMPSNLAKATFNELTGVWEVVKVNGKTVKPEGWTPPDIKSELERQGWNPDE